MLEFIIQALALFELQIRLKDDGNPTGDSRQDDELKHLHLSENLSEVKEKLFLIKVLNQVSRRKI